MSAYIGRHVRTVMRWHYEKLHIPFLKTAPGKGGKVRIARHTLDIWIRAVHVRSLVGATAPQKYTFPNRKKEK